MKRSVIGVASLIVLLAVGPLACVQAQSGGVTAYRCTSAQGQVSYQGTPCKAGQQQQTMQLQDDEPGMPTGASAAIDGSPAVVTTASPVAHVPPVPRTPPSTMYRCTRATDNKTYVSDIGNPPPYYAPLAMTNMLPTPLGQIAPGRVSPNAAMIASRYTMVQDQCAPMSPEDTCSQLRSDYDDTERKLSRAFKSDAPPLLKRESALLAQLSHC